MTWPNFFIVGTSRAGTTSLYNYLSSINEIYLAPKGKIHYFFPQEFMKGNAKGEYLKIFEKIKNQKAIGEYAGYLDSEESPNLIKSTISNPKIIICLRNPIERGFSHYLMSVREGSEKNDFSNSFEKFMNPIDKNSIFYKRYIELGLYYEKVKRFLDIFGKENVMIIIFEEFTQNPKKIFQELLDFLEIKSDIPSIVGTTYNAYGEPLGDIGTKMVKNKILNNLAKKILSKNTRVKLLRILVNKKGKKPKLKINNRIFLEQFYYQDGISLQKLLEQKLPWEFLENVHSKEDVK